MYRSPFRAVSRQTTPFKKKGNWKCGYHTGVDQVCDSDRTIVAIGNGKVLRVNSCGTSYGNHVVYLLNEGYVVLCAHMRDTPAVKVGQIVKAGQLIGIMGNTGNSSGAHLHIEIQKSSTWQYAKNLVNPNSLIDWKDFGAAAQDTTSEKKEVIDVMNKVWKNGSTAEPVYQTIANCKNKKNSIGSIAPRGTANCTTIIDGCYLIFYNAEGTIKCGFVKYHGGVK